MKSIIKNLIRPQILFFLMAFAPMASAQSTYVSITGKLKDAKTGDKIAHATITVPGTNIGTVSNSEGAFILKVNKSLNAEYFEVSHLSYATTRFRISEATEKDKTYYLEVRPVQLREVTIVPKDADAIVMTALGNIKKNYSNVPNMMTGFYREAIRQRGGYITLSEAVVDIYKASYTGFKNDLVKIFKGHRGSNVEKADTLSVKLQGGPDVMLLLDIVRNPEISIGLDDVNNYNFRFETIVNIDDKPNYVISFTPFLILTSPLYYGKLYISQETMAITRAEFSLDLSDIDKASGIFIKRKPGGLAFVPISTNYLVTYKQQNGKYYLNYVRADLKFKCDWKKQHYKNTYTLMSELAITDRWEQPIVEFTREEIFRSWMVFDEKVENFADPEFWGESNIIEPDKSIEDAIKKLSKSKDK
jgi:hypothetical protein